MRWRGGEKSNVPSAFGDLRKIEETTRSGTGVRVVSSETKASLLGRNGRLYLGNVTMHMHVFEVTLWRDSMVRFYCDDLFRGWEGCAPGGVVDVSAEEIRLRGRRHVS